VQTFLGIDGGGTKTRALLVDSTAQRIHCAESGPSNLNIYDEATVRSSLQEVVASCIQATDAKPSAACFGLAGAANPETKAKLADIVQTLGLETFKIVSDAEIALEGAFRGGSGILLIAGTGSVCFGKSAKGTIHRTGGWGWLADDAGSAGWIGQRALEIALQEQDGRRKGTAFRDTILPHLGIHSEEDISPLLYQPLIKRSKIAELSSCVFDLARQQNCAAIAIYDEALDALEALVRTTAGKMTNGADALVFSGGLFNYNTDFRQALETKLSDFKIHAALNTPLEGAIAIARKI
jgi:N-acetylglucosamine kinase-like BadF-type ATPase